MAPMSTRRRRAGSPGAAGSCPTGDAIQQRSGTTTSAACARTWAARRRRGGGDGRAAYATGNDVAFARDARPFTAAHEAAHVVQQRGGVRCAAASGAGDDYEQHADAVADRVVRGESAEPVLDPMAHRGARAGRRCSATKST